MNGSLRTLLLAISASLCLAGSLHAAGRDQVFSNPNPDRTWSSKAGGYFSRAKNYAVVISISDYVGTGNGGFSKLGTHNDAEKMKNFLLNDAGFDYVRVITDDKVTKATIDQVMTDDMRTLVGPNDRFVFYWSGHGTQFHVGNRAFGFLPLHDSKTSAYSSMISMEDFTRWNSYLSARHALFILDACLSGLAGSQKKGPLDVRLEQLSQPARYLIAAGTDKEETIAEQRWGGSLFTEAFINAARAGAPDEVISIYKLIDRIQDRVGIEKTNAGWRKGLTPQIHDLVGSDGAFFFLAKGTPWAPGPSAPQYPNLPSTTTAAIEPKVGGPETTATRPGSPGLQPLPTPLASPPAPVSIKWRLTSSLPKSIPSGVEEFARRVERVTGGQMQIVHFAAGEIVPGLQALDAVQNGTVEMALSYGEWYTGKDTAFHLLAKVPFGFDTRTHLAWRAKPEVRAIFDRLLDPYNVVAIPCSTLGRLEDLWSRKRVNRPEDLVGMKIRLSSFAGRSSEKLGVVPQAMAAGDIYSALEKGTIDAVQWGSPRMAIPLGFSKVATHYYYPSMMSPSAIFDLFVNKPKWNELPESIRKAIEQECVANIEAMVADYDAKDREAIEQLARQNIRAAPFPEAVQKRLYEATRDVLKAAAETAPFFET